MSMTYGHSATESLVAMLADSERPTGLDLALLEEIAAYFRVVRRKYARFEGGLQGVDSRILTAQVPGGMLTNLESHLREQNALDRLDEVLEEIPKVRKDLGMIPLVTPTSQIVGTQALLNVLAGERYKSITKESAGVLKGEYGAAPAPFDAALQASVLNGAEPLTERPADRLGAEMEALTSELTQQAGQRRIALADDPIDDVLTYALFPQVGLRFLQHRADPGALEPPVGETPEPPLEPAGAAEAAAYSVRVNGKTFHVEVAEDGKMKTADVAPAVAAKRPGPGAVTAPLAGTVFKILVKPGDAVQVGEPVAVLEAMKMETDVSAPVAGAVDAIFADEGDAVQIGDALLSLV